MSDVLITPLMNLPNPVPGEDPGPDYAEDIASCFNILDGHNHSPGSGNQINSDGIIINSDLPFNSAYNATQLRSVRFASQSVPIGGAQDLGCLYESGVDLYYNDGSGNQVRITSGGNVNATSSGISSGTATAAFVGSTLVVNANTNTPANIKGGSVLIGNNVVNSKYLTLAPPNAMGADYSLVLPSTPGATGFVTLDTSGNFSGSTIAIAGGITGSNIAANTVSKTNQTAVGQQVSSSCLATGVSVITPQAISNLNVTITTTGRPVMVMLTSDGSGSGNLANISVNSAANGGALTLIRDITNVAAYLWVNTTIAGSIVLVLDAVSSGSHTYTVYGQVGNAAGAMLFNYMVLTAYEL